jgi:hypothetical protein
VLMRTPQSHADRIRSRKVANAAALALTRSA